VFSDRENAVLYFPGGSTPIHHFIYGYASKNAYLRGEWQLSINTLGLVNGAWLVFPGTTYTGSDGTIYEAGYEDSKSSSTVALGVWSPSAKGFVIAIDDGTGFILTYALSGDDNRMIGLGWIEPRGTNPSGSGSAAAAARLLTLSEVKLINGINSSPASSTDRLGQLEQILRQRMAQAQAVTK